MSQEISRTRRVAEQIKRELSSILQFSVKDPRVKLINVNSITVSPDLGHARVYVGSLQTQSSHEEVIQALDKMSGFLRKELGRSLHMRSIPQLRFYYDDTAERGNELSSLIDNAVSEDERKRKDSVRHEDVPGDEIAGDATPEK